MDILTLIGLILGWGCVITSVILDGGHLAGFAALAPFILVFGGTWGAVLMGLTVKEIRDVGQYLRAGFFGKPIDFEKTITTLTEFSTRSRRDGILSLEDSIEQVEDPFLRKGLELAVDGIDLERMHAILEADVNTVKQWYKEGEEIFIKLGGFSPTLGIIGTVLGLVHMLSKLEDPKTMGPAIAAAFIATLYGISFANLFYLPMAHKLKRRAAHILLERRIMMEGIVSLQAGTSPRILEQELRSYLHAGAKAPAGERARTAPAGATEAA
jgi:chemotaxis protein MotA